MDDHLSPSLLDVIVDMSAEDDAGLAPYSLPTPTGDRQQDRDVVQTHLSNILDGHDEEASRAAIEALGAAGARIDAVALDMLRTTGMDAAVMIHLAWISHARLKDGDMPMFRLTAGPARRASAVVKPLDDGRIGLATPLVEGTYWESLNLDHPGAGAIVMNRPLPNNVILALEGRSLVSVVQHPVLDPLELAIRRAFIPIGASNTRIEIEMAERIVAVADAGYDGTRPDRRTLEVQEAPRQRAIPGPTF
jgi:hypothetical protein